jgi:spermidine/putrescine ABC transporter ATP-binding subunit
MVKLENLSKYFGQVKAVDDISLEVEEGDFLTMLGPSGSGKTTTLMLIAGFEFPTFGEIFVDGKSIVSIPSYRRNIGMVFQNYALFPHLTVDDNIAFPLKMRKTPKSNTRDKVDSILDLVQLTGLGSRYPRQLSGGQQQRVALARALVFNPPVLLMDEPLGALDKQLREYMQLEIKHIQEKLGITIVYVTHDQAEALTMSSKIAVMRAGRIEQIGAPDELYEKPANEFVAQFIGESNFLEGRVTGVSGTDVVVQTAAGLEFRVIADKAPVQGEEVKLCLRPEILFFVDAERKKEGINSVDATVEEAIYIGDLIKYKVDLGNQTDLILKLQNRTGTKKSHRGDRVTVAWIVEDGVLV